MELESEAALSRAIVFREVGISEQMELEAAFLLLRSSRYQSFMDNSM